MLRWLMKVVFSVVAAQSMALAGGAGLDPREALADPALEARARSLFQEMRCVVCQSESLDDSEADLAREMRRIVREQIAAGRTDPEIRDYFVSRYGDYALLKPKLGLGTWALWFGPFLLLFAAGGAVIVWVNRRQVQKAEPDLSRVEQEQLSKALDNRDKV